MLALPANFERFNKVDGAPAYWLAVLRSAAGAWQYGFASSPMEVTVSSVAHTAYGLLLNDLEMFQEISFIERSSNISNVTLELNNRQLVGTSTIAALLSNVDQMVLSIYLVAGKDVIDITDALLVWKGKPTGHSYDDAKCIIEAEALTLSAYMKIPPLKSTVSESPVIPNDDIGNVVPLVLGDHTQNAPCEEPVSGEHYSGRIRAGGLLQWNGTDYGTGDPVTSMLYLNMLPQPNGSVEQLWVWIEELEKWALIDSGSYVLDYDDDGYVSVYLKSHALTVQIIQWPDQIAEVENLTNDSQTFFTVGDNNVDGADWIWDKLSTTAGVLKVGTQDIIEGAYSEWYVLGAIGLGFSDWRTEALNLGYIAFNDNTYVHWKIGTRALTGFTWEYGGSSPYKSHIHVHKPNTDYQDGTSDIFDGADDSLQISDYDTDVGALPKTNSTRVCVYAMMKTTDHDNMPDTDDPPDLLDIYYVYIAVGATINLTLAKEPPVLYWTGHGPAIGATIGGRAAIGDTSSICTQPSLQVEKLLREVVGLATADIDTDSFDALYASAVETHVVIDGTERQMIDDVIQEISENADFVYHYDFAGKARLVSISPTEPGSADIVFAFDDLMGFPFVSKTPISDVSNEITIHGQFQRDELLDRQATDTAVLADATSDTAYGTREAEAVMRFVQFDKIDTVDDEMAKKLVNLLANPHTVVEVTIKGIRGAHVEIGDWIGFTSELDRWMTCYGTSWDGLQFMVFGRTLTTDGVTLKAIKFTKVYEAV